MEISQNKVAAITYTLKQDNVEGKVIETIDETKPVEFIFGQGGYMRFLAEFGLLCAGILGVIFSRRPVAFVSVIIAVMLTANLVDLLPNGTQTPLTWLWAGALAGRLELKSEGSASANTPVAESRPERNRRPSAPVYARSLGERPAYRRNFKQTDPSS